ncbi:MAG: MauE/DoxX family redox-associated membrane protein [Ktedonobacteraceae bacterium]
MASLAVISIRLFTRLLLGLILLSVGASKLARPGHFRRGIQDYQLISPALDSRLALSTILAYGLPVAELVAGLALISGFLLLPATALAIFLMVVFSVAMGINLARGRSVFPLVAIAGFILKYRELMMQKDWNNE